MTRYVDWRSRLLNFLAEVEKDKFKYGVNDCCLFAASAIEAMTGVDPAKDFRGHYKTERGGLTAIRKAGYSNQFDFIEKNFTEVEKPFATMGDIGITADGAIVIVGGELSFGVSENGLSHIKNSELVRVFRP